MSGLPFIIVGIVGFYIAINEISELQHRITVLEDKIEKIEENDAKRKQLRSLQNLQINIDEMDFHDSYSPRMFRISSL